MKFRRLWPAAFAVGVMAAATASAMPAQASANFNPVMTAGRSTDAARANAALQVRIQQPDGQEQIGDLRIAVPRTYTFDTNAPGDGAQIGSAQLQAYVNPRPGTLTINATVHDGNNDCDAGSQCVIVKANIPGIGAIELPLEIEQTATEYVIAGDISGLWNDDYVRGLDARLKQLTVDIYQNVGTHKVFVNPATAGNHDFTYAFTSAKIDALGHAGGNNPNCGAICNVPLRAVDYAPTVPYAQAPIDAVSASDTAHSFAWNVSTDRNQDAVRYDLSIAGPTPFSVSGLTTNRFTAGLLSPGQYTWQVKAVDATGAVTAAPAITFTVFDTAGALSFTSAANGDTLLVRPGVGFVYRVAGAKTTAAQYGGAGDLTAPSGVINHDGRFGLTGVYDATTGTAALAFRAGNLRPFLDPAGL